MTAANVVKPITSSLLYFMYVEYSFQKYNYLRSSKALETSTLASLWTPTIKQSLKP